MVNVEHTTLEDIKEAKKVTETKDCVEYEECLFENYDLRFRKMSCIRCGQPLWGEEFRLCEDCRG